MGQFFEKGNAVGTRNAQTDSELATSGQLAEIAKMAIVAAAVVGKERLQRHIKQQRQSILLLSRVLEANPMLVDLEGFDEALASPPTNLLEQAGWKVGRVSFDRPHYWEARLKSLSEVCQPERIPTQSGAIYAWQPEASEGPFTFKEAEERVIKLTEQWRKEYGPRVEAIIPSLEVAGFFGLHQMSTAGSRHFWCSNRSLHERRSLVSQSGFVYDAAQESKMGLLLHVVHIDMRQ